MKTAILLQLAITAAAQMVPSNSMRGERLFASEHCIECHSMNGKGAHSAPDLSRQLDRDYTPATLASTMWNHAPTMWRTMKAKNVGVSVMDNQAAADLFAFFYCARYFEKSGDAGRGKRLFADRHCSQCHGITDSPNTAALPVGKWESLADPIALTTAMWNHAGVMSNQLIQRNIEWPALNGQEMTDLLVYLRNATPRKEAQSTFQITTGEAGKAVFEQKRCVECHRAGGSAMTWRIKGKTLTDVAAEMWDHGRRMPAATIHLETGEMREVLSYVWAAQFFASDGDSSRGKRVFLNKRCGTCHDDSAANAPPLKAGLQGISGITMVSALWRHGPAMLESMQERKVAWPRFDSHEMSDLIAYLNTRK